ncbi:helix-turn-helix domain-containing protein [Eubacteriales bacterium KG127]
MIGLRNPEKSCLDIENKINDSIKPQPAYELKINETDNTVSLKVESGKNKPYMYKSKAYRRNDSATIEVDKLELLRLILEGKNINYEELPAKNQSLTFNHLEKIAKKEIGIENLDNDVLKTLNLYTDVEGYKNAAELLADENTFPGIYIAKFGESISIIIKRVTIKNKSVLEELEKTRFIEISINMKKLKE